MSPIGRNRRYACRVFWQFLLCLMSTGSLLLTGCENGASGLPWEVSSDGYFQTRDLERAQAQIPFKIVLPSYLPPGMAGPPAIKGPMKGVFPPYDPSGGVQVEVLYSNRDGHINVFMTNYPVPRQGERIDIGGIAVLKTTGMLISSDESEDGSKSIQTVRTRDIFYFGLDGIYLEVKIYGYSAEEETRVVVSLIANE